MNEEQNIRNKLSIWFSNNKRDMPWRHTKDPYQIWLSEVILQQTQISQGTPYFNTFIKNYPKLKNLAESSESKVLKLWQGLGYYSRARNMLHTAKHIYYNLDGKFPENYLELLKLKGVGEYTAAAIASISFNQSVAVVDGNVVRVISRLYKLETPFNTAIGKKTIGKKAYEILNSFNPAEHNQAMMELGSMVCKPKNPLCAICPIQSNCLAYSTDTILDYPIKIKKPAPKVRHFIFIVPLLPNGITLITKRTASDIWKNMFTFPIYETDIEIKPDEFRSVLKKDFAESELLKVMHFKHVLTHQIIKASFYIITQKDIEPLENAGRVSKLENKTNSGDIEMEKKLIKAAYQKNNTFEVEIKSFANYYPLPRLITKFIEHDEASVYFK